MRKIIFIALMTALCLPLYSLSNEELRGIMEAEQATVQQGIDMAANISGVASDISGNKYLSKMSPESALTIGGLSKIVIEMGMAQGGLLYKLTRFNRYATDALVYIEVIPDEYYSSRKVSGSELIEIISVLESMEEGETE